MTPTGAWWEKMYSIDTRSIGRVKEMECTAQALKEARAMIATLKKERRKDRAKIQELSEIIHEQNFLLQHNDQYMLELENQLEAIAVPPPEPIIPGPAEEDVEDVQGESGVESGPESL
jgi:cation transport regulator ChaC